MKYLPSLLLLCLMLLGCTSPPQEISATGSTEAVHAIAPSPPQGLYEAGSALETSTRGALRIYPLHTAEVAGLRVMGDGLLLFTGTDATELTLLTGDTLIPSAHTVLTIPLLPEDPSVQIGTRSLSYFDPQQQQTIVLDSALEEVRCFDAPPELVGSPILSGDHTQIYYCTPTAIRAWDIQAGIRRIVAQPAGSPQGLEGLYWHGSVLRCRLREDGETRSLFFSAETGALLHEGQAELVLATGGDGYIASFWDQGFRTLVFGSPEEDRQTLIPADIIAEPYLLPDSKALVTASQRDATLVLDHYDLTTGKRTSELVLYGGMAPLAVLPAGDGSIWLLLELADYDVPVICRWDPAATAVKDAADYADSYYTMDQPDYARLEACQSYAREIGQRYGLEVRIWEAAAAIHPQDLNLEPEHRAHVIWKELELLDSRLAQYPGGMLAQTRSHFTALRLCLVSQVSGESDGAFFLDGTDAYVVLVPGSGSASDLYHGLFHAMETHILGGSSALDQWNTLNPAGFRYDYDYQKNARRDSGIYLTEDNRSFVDTYSMSFPKEDRARVMEHAMLPDNAAMFGTRAMQRKLRALCRGIREAYGLQDSPEVFLWEQYLNK